MINATIVGHLGRDPEFDTTKGGYQKATLAVASSTKRGENENTTWVRVVLFGDRWTGVLPYLGKGAHVAVSGRLELQTWEGRDGDKRTTLEMNADSLELIKGVERADRGDGAEPRAKSKPKPKPTQGADDDIPV